MDFFDCTVIGDVFMDIVVEGCADYGRLFRGGTSYCSFAKVLLGGSGNVAVGLSTLGGKAVFVGKAGRDIFGRLYVQDLKRSRVVTKIFFDKDSPTGLVMVFVGEEKERSFLVFRGANDKLSVNEIEKANNEIKRSKYFYFSGYSLINNPQKDAILQAVELARKYKVKIVFDPGAYNLVKSKKSLFTKLLSLCDVFSPNLKEATAMTNTANMERMISKLREKVPLTALKLGEKGCILISEKKDVRVSGYTVRCLDTTGAGDAFTAALIYGLVHKFPLRSAGRLANWFAAEIVKQIGSRNYPSKTKIQHFLRRLRSAPPEKES